MLQSFHFLRPEWLWAIPFIVVFLLTLKRSSKQNSGWEKVCDPTLLQYQLSRQGLHNPGSWQYMHWLIPLLLIVTIIALAGPSWEKKEQPAYQPSNALVIILDLSLSMNAQDIKPSRVERAKLKIIDILEQKKEGQTALIAFAGDAHTVSPLTIDNKTIKSLLPALDTSIMPLSGSHLVDALITARQLLINSGFNQGDMLLITDGIDPTQEDPLADTVSRLYQQGYRFSAIGVGSSAGSPIPLPNQGGFVKDPSGQVVLSKLSSEPLQHLAELGGGQYHPLSLDNSDFRALLNKRFLNTDDLKTQENQYEQWVDAGSYLSLILIPLSLLAFRKGLMSIVIMLVFLPPFVEPVMASDQDNSNIKATWSNLWATPDQQGQKAFQAQDFDTAADKFSNPNWKASAYYRAGDFDKAAEQYGQIQDANSLYNKGNALAHMQKFQQAISTYDEALKLNPEMSDAIKNRDYIKQLLAQQQQSGQNTDQQSKDQQPKDQQPGEQGQPQQNNSGDKAQTKDSQPGESEKQDSGVPKPDDSSKESKSGSKKNDEAQNKQSSENAQPEQNEASDSHQPQEQDNPDGTPQSQTKAGDDDEPNAQEAKEITPVPENLAEQPDPTEEQSERSTRAEPQRSHSDDVLSQLNQEEQQSLKQWLQRIPDNPGQLLRIKFRNNSLLKQRQQNAPAQYEGDPW